MWKKRKVFWVILITVLVTLLAGLLALNFATPEKKLERKLAHRYAISDQVRDLQNGAEIFPAMLEAIASAQQTINFETYIYWSGDIGRKMAELLAERAQAGVRVNVLLDWVGSLKMEQDLLDLMKQAGVKVHRYRPLHWYNLARMNNRTHRKLLIVDGKRAFTGGVGIADQWEGRAQDPEHWRDMHFELVGPAVTQFQAAF